MNNIEAVSFMSAEDCLNQLEERIKEHHKVPHLQQLIYSVYLTGFNLICL